MLSIKEINFYRNLSEKGLVPAMNCPFNEDSVGNHIIFANLDKNDEVFFNCLTCNTTFTLGLNTETIIKDTLKKYNK
jgi:hypothetical protein